MLLEAMAVAEVSSSGLHLGLFSNILFTSYVKWLSGLVSSHVWLWDSLYFSPICPWDFQARILEWVVISFPREWKAALYFSVSLKMGRLAQWTQCWIQGRSLSPRIWGTFSGNPWGFCVNNQPKGRRNPGTIKVCLDKLPWSLRGVRFPSLLCASGKETMQRKLLGRNVQTKMTFGSRFSDFSRHMLYTYFSLSAVSDSLRPHGLQHARLPCPPSTPGACSNSCPSSLWGHPTISSSVFPFSSCLQSFTALWSFPVLLSTLVSYSLNWSL